MNTTKDGQRKPNGLKTAVKWGALTEEDALLGLAIQKQRGHFIKPTIVGWLNRRIKRRK